MKKLYIQIGLVLVFIMVVYFSHARVFAVQPQYVYLKAITSELNQNVDFSREQMFSRLCSVLFDQGSFENNGFVYDPQQSVFVHLICKNIKKPSLYFDTKKEYFVRSFFKELGFSDTDDNSPTGDRCIPLSSDCDFAQHIPDLFDAIITDYVNMKQANVYGLFSSFEFKEIEDQIEKFSEAYFGINVCDDEADYPKVCRTMKSYLKNAHNLLTDVSIFSVTGISQTSYDCAIGGFDKNMLYCGIWGDTGGSLLSFTNLLYNELFFYRLFVGYYLLELQKNPSILANNSYMKDYFVINKKFSARYQRSQDAISLSLRMLRDLYMAYPFHIGFLMYQERLDGFGKLLAKITTPIYTLYDKLRNVQKPE